MNRFSNFVIVGLLMAWLCPLAAAQNVLTSTPWARPDLGYGTGIYTLDETTAAATAVGGTFSGLAMAFGPGDKLYVAENTDNLLEVDVSTGNTTLIGSIGSATHGMAFGAGQLWGVETNSGSLYTISTADASMTSVTTVAGASLIGGLAYGNGTLYGVAENGGVFSIDTTNGNATGIAFLDSAYGGSGGGWVGSLAYFGDKLYAIVNQGVGVGELFSITTGGTVTKIGDTTTAGGGMTAVPEPATMTLLGIAGAVALLRRRR